MHNELIGKKFEIMPWAQAPLGRSDVGWSNPGIEHFHRCAIVIQAGVSIEIPPQAQESDDL